MRPARVTCMAMGAWGHRTFENDSALDWLGDLKDGEPGLVKETLARVANAEAEDYLDVDDCCAALAAAELVAAALGHGDERLTQEARDWLRAHRDQVSALGTRLARRAVERVHDSSELRELWG